MRSTLGMAKKKHTESAKKSTALPQRLQRVLAAAGIGSRRECEELISEGRVEVDGKIVIEMGVKVDPDSQKIRVDGQRLKMPRLQYFMLNKPPGVVSTAQDPAGRLRVVDLIKTKERVYNVGRLDKSSEGLILVTNDGDLANKLTHPRYGVEKKYLVHVVGKPSRETMEQMQRGIYLAEAKVRVSNVKVKKALKDSTWLEIVLDEGRNREIRRILARLGHKVTRLRRVAIGSLNLGELPLGAHRRLTADEIRTLKKDGEKGGKSRGAYKKKFAKKKATQKRAASGTRKTGKKSRTSKSKRGKKRAVSIGRSGARAKAPARKKPNRKKGGAKKRRR